MKEPRDEAVVYLLKKFAHDSDEEAKALLVKLGEKLEDAAPVGEVLEGAVVIPAEVIAMEIK